MRKTMPEALPIEELADAADIVIECAPSKLVRSIVAPVVSRGNTAIVLSVGALLENEDLIELAKRKWRPDRGADRRADRPRCRDRGGGRHHPFGTDGHTKTAARARRRALSGREQHRHRRISPNRSRYSRARRARRRRAFPPISMSPSRCRSRASAPTAPGCRSGPIRP